MNMEPLTATKVLEAFIAQYYYADAPPEIISTDARELEKYMAEFGWTFQPAPEAQR